MVVPRLSAVDTGVNWTLSVVSLVHSQLQRGDKVMEKSQPAWKPQERVSAVGQKRQVYKTSQRMNLGSILLKLEFSKQKRSGILGEKAVFQKGIALHSEKEKFSARYYILSPRVFHSANIYWTRD